MPVNYAGPPSTVWSHASLLRSRCLSLRRPSLGGFIPGVWGPNLARPPAPRRPLTSRFRRGSSALLILEGRELDRGARQARCRRRGLVSRPLPRAACLLVASTQLCLLCPTGQRAVRRGAAGPCSDDGTPCSCGRRPLGRSDSTSTGAEVCHLQAVRRRFRPIVGSPDVASVCVDVFLIGHHLRLVRPFAGSCVPSGLAQEPRLPSAQWCSASFGAALSRMGIPAKRRALSRYRRPCGIGAHVASRPHWSTRAD